MHVFVTGATGFIGSRIVPELLRAGHHVIGLTRSDSGARALAVTGAEVYRGTLEDPEGLSRAAAQADAVIHTAFDHDFSNFAANCEKDSRVIAALGAALRGSDRPLIITSGTAMGSADDGRPATESVVNRHHSNPRAASEVAGQALLDAGINVSVVRLPQVHDTARQGLISPYIAISREKGRVAYVGEGADRWPAAHVLDVARLYTLALDRAAAGARYHAVDEEGVTIRAIAQAVGAGLELPVVSITAEQVQEHFGWLAIVMGVDMPASSAWTRTTLGWEPSGPGLLADLAAMNYAADQAIVG